MSNREMTSIVVGFDQHPASRAALEFAARLADRLGAHLHVVHVVDDDDLLVDPDADDVEASLAGHVRADAAGRLASFEGGWTYYSRHGNPSWTLAGIADDAEAAMIVIGAARRGPMALVERLLGESVSASAVRLADCPVVIVPEARRRRI